MPFRFILLSAVLVFTGCSTVHTHKQIKFGSQPVCAHIKSECIDEETLRYSVVFRNTGCEVISFDYTIGDKACVVHIDREGPNSGLVENLYPGAEREVESPFKQVSLWVKLGKVICGKRSSRNIAEQFPIDVGDDSEDGPFDDETGGSLPALPTVFP